MKDEQGLRIQWQSAVQNTPIRQKEKIHFYKIQTVQIKQKCTVNGGISIRTNDLEKMEIQAGLKGAWCGWGFSATWPLSHLQP